MSSFDETAWWGSCVNTWHEEQKQFVYASRMGLFASWNGAHPPTYHLGGRTVLDIGGGPASILLKCVTFRAATVLDPAPYPRWVKDRYAHHGVEYLQRKAEECDEILNKGERFDDCWIYNVLQHVDSPTDVLAMARRSADTLRIFEWVDIEPYPGHPHKLTKDMLEEWIGSPGFVAEVDDSGAVGRAFYGVYDLRAEYPPPQL